MRKSQPNHGPVMQPVWAYRFSCVGFVPIAVVARPDVGISTKDTKKLTAYK